MAALARLTKKSDFDRIFSSGKALRRPLLALLAAPNGAGCVRLGVSVPKRLVPLATRRNRVRRLIREGIRAAAAQLPPLDIVVLLKGRKESFAYEPRALRGELDSLLAELPSLIAAK